MRVRARRAGYTEKLTSIQEDDLEPYDLDQENPDEWLVGELVTHTVSDPLIGSHEVVMVGGQFADPATVEPVNG